MPEQTCHDAPRRETLYLIDGHAQIFRAYFAIRMPMRSPVTSEPTQAVFGFAGMLLKLLSQFHPHYVVMAVDTPGKTFRDELFDRYKGTRPSAPEDLPPQIPRILEMVELFGIPVIGEPGLEADDVIATITRRILEDPSCDGVQIRIVSKDKDLEQLLGDRVTMFDIHSDTTIDVAYLRETKGVAPEQVVDLLALTGDTVDNVPGVEGIGPKTAAQLIQQYGSIDGIFAHIDQIKGKRRENLEKARGHLPLSRTLVTLKSDADLPFSLEAARIRPLNVNKILTLFQQLGFHRFQDEVRRLAAQEGLPTNGAAEGPLPPAPPAAFETGSVAAPLPDLDADPFDPDTNEAIAGGPVAVSDADYRAVTTREALAELAATLRAQPLVSVDTETTGLDRDARLCGLSFSWAPGQGVYVPVRSSHPATHLDEATVLAALGPLLADPDLPKCGHNLKFDARVLLRHGVKLRGVVFDSMLASTLLDPMQSSHKLDHIAFAQLGYTMIPITDLIGEGEGQGTMDVVPLDRITRYAAEDTDIVLRLYHRLLPRLEAEGQAVLLHDIEAPLTVVLAEMEHNGILCDPEELRRQGEVLGARVEDLKRRIWEAAGVEFVLDSPKQLGEVLFDRLGLASGKKTKTGRSTDIQVLEKLASQEDPADPRTSVPRLIIEYRQLQKLISTYLGNLRASVDPRDGRIHTTFHQLVTATGRLASHGPNLQNIPVRTDIGRQIRKAFHAPEGYRLICADYSQIELRLLAHLSQDKALLDAFSQEQDIHAAVASQVFGVPLEEVTREQRGRAKTINFGIIYGVTAFGLSQRIDGLDVPAATQLITDYKARFPGIDAFMQRCVQQALERGYVTTLSGRRRAIPEVHAANANTRSLGERLAINTVVQGSAADLIKAAMVNVMRRTDRDALPLKMLLQIHDELVLEAPESEAERLAKIVCEEMERAMTLSVPLRAEAGIGRDWSAVK
jgi:DNA polymerase-1